MFKVFQYAKVGDKVWSPIHEGGEVVKVDNDKIHVDFADGLDIVVNLDGREHEKQKNPSIEWIGCEMIGNLRLKDVIYHHVDKKPYRKLKKGESRTLNYYIKEHEFRCGKVCVWRVDNKNNFSIFFSDRKENGLIDLVEILTINSVKYDDVFNALADLEWI